MIRLFNEKSITDIFEVAIRNIPKKLSNIIDSQILNVDLNELAANTANHNTISELEIDFEQREVEVVMFNILGSNFPPGTAVRRNQSYPCARVNYTFTVRSGDIELLSIRPQSAIFNYNVSTEIRNNKFTISYQTKYATVDLSEEVKREVKQSIKAIIDSCKIVIDAINKEVIEFNEKLPQYYYEILESKKKVLQKDIALKKDLNDL